MQQQLYRLQLNQHQQPQQWYEEELEEEKQQRH